MTKYEKYVRFNEKYGGKFLLVNGIFKGQCSGIDVVGAPSGFNNEFVVNFYWGQPSLNVKSFKGFKITTPQMLHKAGIDF